MKRTHRSLAFVIGLAVCFLAGCAATVTKPTAEAAALATSATPTAVALLITGSPTIQASADWQMFQAEWRTAFASAAASAGLPFTYLDAEGGEQPGGVVLARVTVTKYRYVTPGARIGFGIFTGNAYINADAEFFELPSRRSIGSRTYSTSSSAFEGIFSAMTDKQVIAISDAMIRDIKGK
jgi:hypothetical protein